VEGERFVRAQADALDLAGVRRHHGCGVQRDRASGSRPRVGREKPLDALAALPVVAPLRPEAV
jgi:hypothetical protein